MAVLIGVLVLICIAGIRYNWKQNHRTKEEIEKEKAEMEARRKRRTIIKTEIIDKGIKMPGSGIGRTVVGGLIAGETGAIIGALSKDRRPRGTTTFRIYYEDGHSKIVTVRDGMGEWKDYIKYLPKS